MRGILVDWLIEITHKFRLFDQTIYTTIKILDEFLLNNIDDLKKEHLQLAGIASMLIASKFEEVYPPSVQDLVYMCANSYS
jgi:hypothetical protein